MQPIALLNGMQAASMRILIVEDEQEHAEILEKLLRKLGFRWIHLARSIESACGELSRRPFDLLLTDGNLPDGTGFQLAERIEIPTIMLTANRGHEHIDQARKAGITQFIAKPFTGHTLREKLLLAFQPQKRTATPETNETLY